MEPKKIVIVVFDDWEGLYVDGKLETERHSIRLDDFIELIDKYKSFESIKSMEISEERMEELGYSLPQMLSDIFN